MDNFDGSSNCSDVSIRSEGISVVSSLSGLSGYNEEFLQLRHSINPSKYPLTFVGPKHISGKSSNEDDRITSLNTQLQNCLKQNEKYKNDNYNLQRNIELNFHDKIEKLLRTKRQLEDQLDYANKHIERLISDLSLTYGKGHKSYSDKRVIELERTNHELHQQLNNIHQDIIVLKNQNFENDRENKELKIQINDLKIDNETKESCIRELKSKITEQHIENENVNRNVVVLENSLREVNNDLVFSKKSELWYKEQLHSSQQEKRELVQEVCKLTNNLQEKNTEIETVNLELSKMKIRYDELQFNNLIKEKNAILKKVDEIKSSEPKFELPDNLENLTNYYESTIDDLCTEIKQIKVNVSENQTEFDKLVKENSELMSDCLKTKKLLQQNESNLEQLENSKKDIAMRLLMATERNQIQSEELQQLRKEIADLKIELNSKHEEKSLIETTIQTIRNQFSKFKLDYKRIKDELNEKNKQILQLQTEKQELFMSNNWNICELEKLKELQSVLIVKDKQYKELFDSKNEDFGKFLKDLKLLQNELDEKDSVMENLRQDHTNLMIEKGKEIDRYEGALLQYKNLVTQLENQITDLRKKVQQNDYNSNQLKDNLKILKEEINKRDEKLVKLQTKFESASIKEINNNSLVEIFKNIINNSSENQNIVEHDELRKIINQFVENMQWKRNGFKESDQLLKKHLDEIQHLKVVVKVKELEKKELQKKYQINYRTLLKKVKEHMKGRNQVEKHNNYLQTMYNSLFEENNTLKLKIHSHEFQIDNFQQLVDKYKGVIAKLKQTIVNLEETIKNISTCSKCIENEAIINKHNDLENLLVNSKRQLEYKENEMIVIQKQLKEVLMKCSVLESNEKSSLIKISDIRNENVTISSQLSITQNELENSKEILNNLNIKLTKEQELNSSFSSEIKQLHNSIEDLKNKNIYLVEKIQALNAVIQEKCNLINEIEKNRTDLEANWRQHDENTRKIVNKLKIQLHLNQDDNISVKNDKFFLQRLCSDLKVALEAQINHNKVLKEQLNTFSKEKQPFNSLPNVLPSISSPMKYDETYINQLLHENRAPLNEKPLSEIQGCLNNLKQEIFALQEQIVKKNKI